MTKGTATGMEFKMVHHYIIKNRYGKIIDVVNKIGLYKAMECPPYPLGRKWEEVNSERAKKAIKEAGLERKSVLV